MDWLWLFLWTVLASGAVGFFTSFDCLMCSAFPGSNTFQLVISGVTNDGCGTLCASDTNGTWTLGRIGPLCIATPGSTTCALWRITGVAERHQCRPCMFLVVEKVGSDYITRLTIGYYTVLGLTVQQIVYEYNHGTTKPDCSAFSGLVLAFVSEYAPFIRSCSNFAAASVTLTSIP